MGYWSALFYEDQSTWSSTVAEVCSTILNYGVEIPWCVCSQSWSVISIITEYVTFAALAVSAFLGLRDWWCLELTVASVVLLFQLPIIIRRSRGNWYVFFSHLSSILRMLGLVGCFLELSSGLQGGLVFGGKLYYPSLALLALAASTIHFTLVVLEQEACGYTVIEERDDRFGPPLDFFSKAMKLEVTTFIAVATFGLPKLEADTELNGWLFLVPGLLLWKATYDYVGAGLAAQEHKEANGEAVKPATEAPKAPEKPKQAEQAKSSEKEKEGEKKKDAKEEEETGKEKEEEKKQKKSESSLLGNIKNLFGGVYNFVAGAICWVVRLQRAAKAWVLSLLPWESVLALFFKLGCVAVHTWAFWTLTEDFAALFGLPLLGYVAPEGLLRLKEKGKLKANCHKFLLETCTVGSVAIHYYLFKTNIVRY